jgi:hypothetical protein
MLILLHEIFTVSKNIPNKEIGSYVVYILCLFVLDLYSSGFTTSVEWLIIEEQTGKGVDGSGRDCFGGCHSGDYEGHGILGYKSV